jgi:hypothetical protein
MPVRLPQRLMEKLQMVATHDAQREVAVFPNVTPFMVFVVPPLASSERRRRMSNRKHDSSEKPYDKGKLPHKQGAQLSH